MGEFDFGHTTNIWLVNKNGTAILQNNSSADYSYLLEDFSPQEKGSILSSHGKRFVLNIRPVTENGWYLYTATPFREVSEPLTIFVLQAILLGAAMVAILFFLSRRTASSCQILSSICTYYGSLPQRYETNGLSRTDSGFG